MTGAPAGARAVVISISSSRAAGVGEDESGARLLAYTRGLGLEIAGSELISDDRALIEARLRHWSDIERCELILTTGGTGLSPTDLTPEATLAVIEREVPGIGEAMRAASSAFTRNWMLSRGVAGLRGASLIVNFPGNPASIEQAGAAIEQALAHALSVMRGSHSGHR